MSYVVSASAFSEVVKIIVSLVFVAASLAAAAATPSWFALVAATAPVVAAAQILMPTMLFEADHVAFVATAAVEKKSDSFEAAVQAALVGVAVVGVAVSSSSFAAGKH